MEINTDQLLGIIGRKQVEIEVLRSQNEELIKLVRRQEAELNHNNDVEGETDESDRREAN